MKNILNSMEMIAKIYDNGVKDKHFMADKL